MIIDFIITFALGYITADNKDRIINDFKNAEPKAKEVKAKIINSKPIISDGKGCVLEITEIWVDQIDKNGKPLQTCRGRFLKDGQKSRIIYKKGKGK